MRSTERGVIGSGDTIRWSTPNFWYAVKASASSGIVAFDRLRLGFGDRRLVRVAHHDADRGGHRAFRLAGGLHRVAEGVRR